MGRAANRKWTSRRAAYLLPEKEGVAATLEKQALMRKKFGKRVMPK